MIRIFLTIVLPFLLPTLLYVLWLATLARPELTGPGPWRLQRVVSLIAAGVVLTALLLFFIGVHVGSPEGTYVPPRYIDGRVVPGHVVPDAPAQR